MARRTKIVEAAYDTDGGERRFRLNQTVFDVRDASPYVVVSLGKRRLRVWSAGGFTKTKTPDVLTTSFDHARLMAEEREG